MLYIETHDYKQTKKVCVYGHLIVMLDIFSKKVCVYGHFIVMLDMFPKDGVISLQW